MCVCRVGRQPCVDKQSQVKSTFSSFIFQGTSDSNFSVMHWQRAQRLRFCPVPLPCNRCNASVSRLCRVAVTVGHGGCAEDSARTIALLSPIQFDRKHMNSQSGKLWTGRHWKSTNCLALISPIDWGEAWVSFCFLFCSSPSRSTGRSKFVERHCRHFFVVCGSFGRVHVATLVWVYGMFFAFVEGMLFLVG